MNQVLDSLDNLAQDVDNAYLNEIQSSEQSNSRRSFFRTESIRNMEVGEERGGVTTIDMLDSWKQLIKSLYEQKVFLNSIDDLHKLFYEVSAFDDSMNATIKTIIDLMTQAVEHEDEEQTDSSECRYVTLIEILFSFTGQWQMSDICQAAWEAVVDDDHIIDDALHATPESFRQLAYGVLMSLRWVPKAPGLREICGFETETQADIPPVVVSIFCQIRSTPLPRHDYIHQLLNRLKGGEDVSAVAITSLEDSFARGSTSQGLGKTTLAAMVTAHPLVQSSYCVLWLRLHRPKQDDFFGVINPSMTYQQYVTYLNSLCEQLGVEHSWPGPVQSLEEKSLRRKKEEEKMFQLKREMTSIVESKASKGVLMVLDDVLDDQEIEWFWFLGNQSLLVTTLSQSLSVDWTLELEMLSEDEALELFLTEADYPPLHVLSTSLEAKSIVHRCGYHPLTIRTVARWFRLKQVTAGVVKGLEELNQELSNCAAKLRHSRGKVNTSIILEEVMNLMLSPVLAAGGQPTTLMKMCLSSMAIVFQRKVPTEAVHLLWGQLLRTEPDAIRELGDNLTPNQIRKRVRFISEALSSLGLLSSTETSGISFVEIHHEMQAVYAIECCREMQFSDSVSETIRRWHEAFASAYLAKKVESDRDGTEDKCRAYALEFLLNHMLNGCMYQKVAVLLRDERFLEERLTFLGWEKGMAAHANDCQHLLKKMNQDESLANDAVDVVSAIYLKVGAFVADFAETPSGMAEAAKALSLIGYALADMGRFTDAASQYKAALKLVHKTSDVAATIHYSLSTVYLARSDHEKALKSIKDCLKIMDDGNKDHALYPVALMLEGDAHVMHYEYRKAMQIYDLALDQLYTNSTNYRVEIGTALGRKGRLLYIMGEVDKAYDTLDECLKWKEKIDESSCELASILDLMGDICIQRKDKNGALKFFDQAYRTYEFHRADAEETDIHIVNGKTDALHQDLEGCNENFQMAMESMKKLPRTFFERSAYDLRVMGRSYMFCGDELLAIQKFNECLKQTKDKGEESLERAAALLDLGDLYIDTKQMDLAMQSFQQALKIHIVKLGDCAALVPTLLRIGKLHRDLGDLDQAISFATKALELTERLYGDSDPRVGDILFEVADLKLYANDSVEALVMFGECLDLRRKQHSDRHPEVANVLEKLGQVHLKSLTYEKSYQCFVEALDIRQIKLEPTHPDIARTYHSIGIVARKVGQCERALHFLLEALHIRKGLDDTGATVMTLTEIGHVHRQLQDDISALGCYEKSVEMLTEHFGPSDGRLVEVFLPLGHLMKKQGSLDEAKSQYERALKIAKKEFGDDHTKTGSSYRSLGLLQFDLNFYEDALENLSNFVKIQDSKKEKNTVDYILALQLIGDIKLFKGLVDEASSAYASANNAYSDSKELSKKYPIFRAILDRRLANQRTKKSQAAPTGLFARITGEFGRLSDEVNSKADGIQSEPDEIELRSGLFFDD